METQHLRDRRSAAKARWHRDVQSCRVGVGEIVKAERCLVTVYSCRLIAPVTGPEHPEDQVRPVWLGKPRQPVNAAMFANPIPGSYVVNPIVARVSERRRLLRSKVATLRFCELVEIFLSLKR